MKNIAISLSIAVFLSGTALVQANPEIPLAVSRAFGTAVAEKIVLLKGSATTGEPLEWKVYARDAFRPEETLRIHVKQEGTLWTASAEGGGARILDRVPTQPLNFAKLRYRSADARLAAGKSAALAQTTFAKVDYQLAANAETGVAEWGLALLDDTGYEVGFVVVSAETGAVTFQDWTPRVPVTAGADDEGERAARAVKRGVRKAWNWTDNARKETRGFFRELFR